MQESQLTLLFLGYTFHNFTYEAFTLFGGDIPVHFSYCTKVMSLRLHLDHISMEDSAWPVLLSVALTNSISSDFFSCRY